MSNFHPDLALVARFLPRITAGPRLLKVVRRLARDTGAPRSTPGVRAFLRDIPGARTARVFVPEGVTQPMPAMLWIHGGGFIMGSPAQDDEGAATFARELGMTVVAPSYRLAPEHPFPAALDDLYAALAWIHANAPALGVRTDRIVIAGASAGGGLAAGLTLLARDRKEIPVAFQLLVYPMLDDRTVGKTIDGTNHRLWNAGSNRFGWTSYLGREPGGADVPVYAAPARAESLAGLPPTWIGVGTFDLFHDEDVEYAKRLEAAGVPVELEIVPGAFHGFDVLRRANVVKTFRARQIEALRRALV
ncbi:alpha/beta hydrolase [Polyangium jinanense]|uniref:Alpha/beta hydrolase n=1 Tax=Polyangium jinanense TaxID=2829994 RepID=A0A9X3XCV3_9BACT|nr:alpha/beta hydrolase [Polyangium jinanense]MDC3961777.1 alpha/beta hydrolase [Polyangium jinanense]MDC3988329.1 alpha/beta hydrolase [Polyangium jinanense]